MSIKKVTISGLFWSLIEAAGSQGIRFLIGIVLARLLLPEMFGLIAMLMIFITLGEIFVDCGFGTALIQKQKITELDICSVFYFNIIVGISAASFLFFTAPVVASFYNQPLLTPMARALSLIFVFNAMGMTQGNLLVKKVDFKSQAKINTLSNLASGTIGIVLAYNGYGVWCLIIQQISASALRNLLYWVYSDWRPQLSFSILPLITMMKFGLSILLTGILNRTTDSIYYMVIGKLFTPSDLGFFSRAQTLQGLPSTTIATLVGRVTFPVFSKLQNDPEMMKTAIQKTIIILTFVVCPIMLCISATAKSLILLLLTDKWLPSVPYLQLLCVVGMFFPLEWIRQQAIQANGRPDLSLRVEIVKKCILFLSIALMWRWGIIAIIAGMIAASFISLVLNIYYLSKLTHYSLWEQFTDILPYLLISVIMYLILFFSEKLLLSYKPFYILLIQVATGSCFYLGLSLLLKTKAFLIIKNEVSLYLNK